MIDLMHRNYFHRLLRNQYQGHSGFLLGDGSVAIAELRLTPKASSTGAEGTIYYDSDDDHIYVATE